LPVIGYRLSAIGERRGGFLTADFADCTDWGEGWGGLAAKRHKDHRRGTVERGLRSGNISVISGWFLE
jgi:hypothetical protein